MARRKKATSKKHTKRSNRRRSRIGAISSDTKSLLMQTLGGIGGAVVGSYVGGVVKDAMSNVDGFADYAGYAEGAAQLAAGFFLPKLVKSSNPIFKGMQMGLMINGGLSIVKTTGMLPGVGGINDYTVPMVAGIEDDRSRAVPLVGNVNSNRTNAMYATAINQ